MSINLEDIEDVAKEPSGGQNLKDRFFGGGLRDRLRIECAGGSSELFVVSNLPRVINEITTILNDME